MGAQAYKIIEKYQQYLQGDIIEIGSERGEGSTSFFHQFATKQQLHFYSVDMEAASYNNAHRIIGECAYHMRGEDFLQQHYGNKNAKITFAYLDNFDFIYPYIEGSAMVAKQIKTYEKNGLTMNNDNSKQAHLTQANIIMQHYAAKFCYLLFDDTYINDDNAFDGKGGLAVPMLLRHGWILADYNFVGKPHQCWCGLYRFVKNKK